MIRDRKIVNLCVHSRLTKCPISESLIAQKYLIKWAISAIGQSCRLITDWFSVRVRGGPPNNNSYR